MDIQQEYRNVGRNDPCPCKSGKKFKKCHGESLPWQGNAKTAQASDATADENAGNASGDLSTEANSDSMPQFDPSKMDLNWLAQFSGAIQRLPKGQLQHLQILMQKAMAGKDVARELEEFQRKLPPSFQELLNASPKLDEQIEDAQNSAPAELSEEQRAKLQEIQKNNEKAGLSRLWNRFKKKQ